MVPKIDFLKNDILIFKMSPQKIYNNDMHMHTKLKAHLKHPWLSTLDH